MKPGKFHLLSQSFEIVPGLLTRQVDSVLMVVNTNNGNCYELNSNGQFVWGCLERGGFVSEILPLLVRQQGNYDVAAEDLEKVIDQLLAHALIRPRTVDAAD